ncbi:MAG: gluconolaconase [Thermomicrobiales bacterium]|nr:gluconolaconase [Thermomicrobiales bacterium]
MSERAGSPPAERPIGELEQVFAFYGAMPTGIAVSHQGRIFVNYPRWGDPVDFSVAELRDGREVPFPNAEINREGLLNDQNHLVSVQSVVIDPEDRLWMLDTGSPLHMDTEHGGPKLVCVNLASNSVTRTILFPTDVALPTSYLNDVRFDLGRGSRGTAYITDSSARGPNAIIVVDLASGESWRRLNDHPTTKAEPLVAFMPIVEGRPFLRRHADGEVGPGAVGGVDGIAISEHGQRIYYSPLGSRYLHSVLAEALVDRGFDDAAVAATLIAEGDKGGGGDGLESDDDGGIYATNYEQNAILRRGANGIWETLVKDPRLLWPDSLAVASNGYLYAIANQLHRQGRYHAGHDLRQKPYALFRIRIDHEPVLLR